jgi:polar amino acid transport system permease protein
MSAEHHTQTSPPATTERLLSGIDAERVRLRHPWRLVGVAVVIILIAMAIHAALTQPGFDWPTVWKYLFDESILTGVRITIVLTIAAMAIGIVVGIVIAIMKRSENLMLSGFAGFFIWAFRGVPTLVQLLLWYNIAALFPTMGIGIPFGPEFISGSPNEFMTPLLAAMLGLGLCEGAYMAEIVRGGILAVDKGQAEAAAALGMTDRQALRRIIMPQAMRTIIPPTGNQVIAMLKYTSLASVISVTELLQSAQQIYQRTFAIIPLLIVASIWYLVLTTILTGAQMLLEKRFGRGVDVSSSRRRWRRGLAPTVDQRSTDLTHKEIPA